MPDPAISLLRDLVAIDSVNPSLVSGAAGEGAVAERIAAAMRGWGLDVAVKEAAPGRPNVFGIVDGAAPGPTLMFCGHSDTVGVEGMRAPFDPVIRDGRLFGRGSQDMKGGLAAMLDAARILSESSSTLRGRVVIAVVVDEEYASIGADAAVKDWAADGAIVTEPTDLVIGVGHKGFEWVQVDTEGIAAHGSRPDDGVDAIMMMGRVLHALEAVEQGFIDGARHPSLGRPSLHASIVAGGHELSTYPDACSLRVERRTVAGEPPRSLLREVEAILDDLRGRDPRFRAQALALFDRPPYLTPEDHPLPRLLGDVLNGASTGTVSFWTDAAILGAAGIPSVVFGPGGAGLHSVEEYVLVDDVLRCRAALVDVARRFGA